MKKIITPILKVITITNNNAINNIFKIAFEKFLCFLLISDEVIFIYLVKDVLLIVVFSEEIE